jgi:hypothetical protein
MDLSCVAPEPKVDPKWAGPGWKTCVRRHRAGWNRSRSKRGAHGARQRFARVPEQVCTSPLPLPRAGVEMHKIPHNCLEVLCAQR